MWKLFNMAEHMITDLKKRGNKIHVRVITYFIHSKKRDFSFTPGLNSSLLKLSLLVNGSMPTSQCGSLINHNRQPASSPFTKSYVAFRWTHFLSTSNDSWDSSCLLLRDKFCVTFSNELICTLFWFSGKFCVDYVVESYSVWKWWPFNFCEHKFRMKKRIRKHLQRSIFHALLRVRQQQEVSIFPIITHFLSSHSGKFHVLVYVYMRKI